MRKTENMTKKEVMEIMENMGKFLHSYYVNFGEKKYNEFVNKIGESLVTQYGESFSSDNLRIMEAEYVTFNSKINEQNKYKPKKTLDQ